MLQYDKMLKGYESFSKAMYKQRDVFFYQVRIKEKNRLTVLGECKEHLQPGYIEKDCR